LNTTCSKRFFLTASTLILFILSITACNPVKDRNSATGFSLNALEERLNELEDREEIRQLLMKYGQFLDSRDFVSFSQLFAEKDGEWIGGMGRAKSRQGIYDFMIEKIGQNPAEPGPSNFHLFMNDTMELDGDHANATTKWVFMIQNDAGRPEPFYLGHYEDRFVRENGEWKFLKRVAYSDIPADNPAP